VSLSRPQDESEAAAVAGRGVRPAPLWRRLAAIAYDLLVLLAILMTLTIVAILARGGTAIGPGSVWFQLLLLATWWLYFVWCWTHGGQTVGMRAWRLVLEAAGPAAADTPESGAVTAQPDPRIDVGRASLRFVAAGLSTAALGLGFLAGLVDPTRRSWHDRLSGTQLNYVPRSAQAQDRDRRDDE